MTPDDRAQLAALRATFNTSGGRADHSSDPAPPHWSDMITPAYTPEVAGLYADPTDAALDPAAEPDLAAIGADDTDEDPEDNADAQ